MIYWVIASINNPYCQTGTGTFQNINCRRAQILLNFTNIYHCLFADQLFKYIELKQTPNSDNCDSSMGEPVSVCHSTTKKTHKI